LLAAGGSSTSTKTPILAKGFEDVTTIDDIYGWIGGVATPVLWGPASSSNSMQGLVRHFNRVVGGMRVIQTRAKEEKCPGLDGLREVYSVNCYPQDSDLSEERFAGEDPDEKGRYKYWLDIEHAVEKVKEDLQGMKEGEWISEATLQTLVETMLYNGEVGQFVLVQSFFTVDRGGSIKSKMKICALPTEVYPSWSAYFGDALWAALLIYLLVGEVYSIWSHLRKGKIKRLISVWVLLNWMAILGGIGIGAFFGWVAKRLDEVAEKITKRQNEPNPPTFVWKSISGAGCGNINKMSVDNHDPSYTYDLFPTFDAMAREKLTPLGVKFVDLSPLYLRGDAHPIGQKDCLHFCAPGPVDIFPRLLHHVLQEHS